MKKVDLFVHSSYDLRNWPGTGLRQLREINAHEEADVCNGIHLGLITMTCAASWSEDLRGLQIVWETGCAGVGKDINSRVSSTSQSIRRSRY